MWPPPTVVETHRDYVLAAWACRVLRANGLSPLLRSRPGPGVGTAWVHDVGVPAGEADLAAQVLDVFAGTEVPSFFRAEALGEWNRLLGGRDRRSG